MNEGQGLLRRLAALAAVFVKLGTLGFGGPAAHLALLEDEVVSRRRWLSREQFLDLVGVTHLIPGPNSTEMAIHLGLLRAGFPGMLVAGACFIVPAVAITAGFAWAYVEYGSLPAVSPLLEGIQPAVLAVILAAVVKLGRTAARTWRRAGIGVAVALAVLLGAGEVWTLLAGGFLGMFLLVRVADKSPPENDGGSLPLLLPPLTSAWSAGRAPAAAAATLAASAAAAGGVSLWKLGLFFLKVGAVLYGGGYVLVAFLEGELVHDWEWLSDKQLLDAIAIGQFTPGPILSTATFVGYLLAGAPGAVVATVAIFFPSFVFVVIARHLLPRLREGAWKPAFLDAINVSAVGLMAVAILKLGQATLFTRLASGRPAVDASAWLIAIAAATVLIRWKISPVWVVLGGGLAGWLFSLGGW